MIYDLDTKVVTISGVKDAAAVSVTVYPPEGASATQTLATGLETVSEDPDAGNTYRGYFSLFGVGLYYVVARLESAAGHVTYQQSNFRAQKVKES